MNWKRLNKLRATAMLLETKKLVEMMESAAAHMPCVVSLLTARGIAEKLIQAEGIEDFWAHMLHVLMQNGSMAPGGLATTSAQKSYLRLLKRADKALGVMRKNKEKMDKQRIQAVRREAKSKREVMQKRLAEMQRKQSKRGK